MVFCERCGAKMKSHTTSYFNTQIICLASCKPEEEEHPLYSWAKQIENKEVQMGNYKYPGVFSSMTWEQIKSITSIQY